VPLESPTRVGIGEVRGQKLDGGWPMELGAGGAIDDAHATGTEQAFDTVLADKRASTEPRYAHIRCASRGRGAPGEQRLHEMLQLGIPASAGGDERGTVRYALAQCGVVQISDLLVTVDRHTDLLCSGEPSSPRVSIELRGNRRARLWRSTAWQSPQFDDTVQLNGRICSSTAIHDRLRSTGCVSEDGSVISIE
jgi:hypothetical protein